MNILIDDTIFDGYNIFSQFGSITALPGKKITNADVKNSDILIVRSRTKVDEHLLQNSRVKFVGSAVAGLDHIDLQYLKDNNIAFAHAGGSNANAVAEYVISAILNLAHNHNFNYQEKTLGVIGVGNAGGALQKKAQKLGINLLLNDIKEGDFVSLEYLLKYSDIISFHTPLDESTYKMLGEHNFHLIKNDCIVINAARGGVIDEASWLQHNGIKIVDCWENEPNINSELLQQTELATQHIAGHSIDAKFQGSHMIYTKLCDFLGTKQLPHSIHCTRSIPHSDNLLDFVNSVYDFTNDDKIMRTENNFEDYRRFYPKRFEWHNYGNTL